MLLRVQACSQVATVAKHGIGMPDALVLVEGEFWMPEAV